MWALMTRAMLECDNCELQRAASSFASSSADFSIVHVNVPQTSGVVTMPRALTFRINQLRLHGMLRLFFAFLDRKKRKKKEKSKQAASAGGKGCKSDRNKALSPPEGGWVVGAGAHRAFVHVFKSSNPCTVWQWIARTASGPACEVNNKKRGWQWLRGRSQGRTRRRMGKQMPMQ
jgi:hypothetical protein